MDRGYPAHPDAMGLGMLYHGYGPSENVKYRDDLRRPIMVMIDGLRAARWFSCH